MRAIAFRMSGCQMQLFVFLLYQFCIGSCVFRADESLSDADPLAPPVEIPEIYRTIQCPCDGVISHLPFVHRLARALRGYAEMELSGGGLDMGDDTANYGCAVAAVYGYAAQMTQNRAERPEEELFLDHHVGRVPETFVVEVCYEKVQYAGVRHTEDYAFFFRGRTAVGFPSEKFHHETIEIHVRQMFMSSSSSSLRRLRIMNFCLSMVLSPM